MNRSQFEAREQAWREFHAWERAQPPQERTFQELLVWLGSSLRIARNSSDLVEEPPEEKAARVARVRRALASVRIPA